MKNRRTNSTITISQKTKLATPLLSINESAALWQYEIALLIDTCFADGLPAATAAVLVVLRRPAR